MKTTPLYSYIIIKLYTRISSLTATTVDFVAPLFVVSLYTANSVVLSFVCVGCAVLAPIHTKEKKIVFEIFLTL